MIIKATIKGEPDVPPFTKIIDYDKEAFFSSASMIEEKIRHNLKINANEALILYCAHVVKSIHAGKKDGDIQKSTSKILSSGNVMIGVPETLRAVTVEVAVKDRKREITLIEPIPTSMYIMAGH